MTKALSGKLLSKKSRETNSCPLGIKQFSLAQLPSGNSRCLGNYKMLIIWFTSVCQANLAPTYKHMGLCQNIHEWFTWKVWPGKIPNHPNHHHRDNWPGHPCSTSLLWKTVMRGFHRAMQTLQIHRLDRNSEDLPEIWKMRCKTTWEIWFTCGDLSLKSGISLWILVV